MLCPLVEHKLPTPSAVSLPFPPFLPFFTFSAFSTFSKYSFDKYPQIRVEPRPHLGREFLGRGFRCPHVAVGGAPPAPSAISSLFRNFWLNSGWGGRRFNTGDQQGHWGQWGQEGRLGTSGDTRDNKGHWGPRGTLGTTGTLGTLGPMGTLGDH